MAGRYADVRHIGEAIDLRMRELGVSVEELTEGLRVKQSTLSRWINGKIRVSREVHQAAVFAFLNADDEERGRLLLRQSEWFGREVSEEAEAAERRMRSWLRDHPPGPVDG